MLSSTNCFWAAAAAGSLGRVTNRADEAMPALRGLFRSTNDYARAVAATTLWRLGGEAVETRQILESLLASKYAMNRAASDLGSMGTAARQSVPALLRASHESLGGWSHTYGAAQCARAVLRIQGESPEAIDVLEEALAFRENFWVRATVAREIGSLGSRALPLIPALRRASQDPDREVRHEAAAARAKLESLSH